MLLDFEKAFNSVPIDKLKAVLDKRLEPNTKELLFHYLDNNRIDIFGKRYKTDFGVPQGGAISGKLFIIYLDEILLKVE